MGNALKYIFSRICCRWCRVRRKKSELDVDVGGVVDQTNVTLRNDVVGEEEYMPTHDVRYFINDLPAHLPACPRVSLPASLHGHM
jgi:hypothetical protein